MLDSISRRGSTERLAALSSSVLFFHVMTSLIQEGVFYLPGFHHTLLLTFAQALCVACFAAVQLYRSSPVPSASPWRRLVGARRVPLRTYFFISLMNTSSVFLTNEASRLLDYTTQVVFKSSKLLVVWLVRYVAIELPARAHPLPPREGESSIPCRQSPSHTAPTPPHPKSTLALSQLTTQTHAMGETGELDSAPVVVPIPSIGKGSEGVDETEIRLSPSRVTQLKGGPGRHQRNTATHHGGMSSAAMMTTSHPLRGGGMGSNPMTQGSGSMMSNNPRSSHYPPRSHAREAARAKVMREILSCFAVVIGLVVFAYATSQSKSKKPSHAKDEEDHATSAWGQVVWGIGCVTVALFCDAFMYLGEEKYCFHAHNCSHDEVQFYIFAFSTVNGLLSLLLSGEVWEAFGFVGAQQMFVPLLLASSFTNYGGTFLLLRILSEFNSSTATVVTSVRKMVTVMCSYLVYPKPFGLPHFLGVLLVMGGVWQYEVARHMPTTVETSVEIEKEEEMV